MGGAKCPRCRGPILRERFVGNSYYCECGWSFLGVNRRSEGSSSYLFAVCLILVGVFLIYASVNPQFKNHIANKVIALTMK